MSHYSLEIILIRCFDAQETFLISVENSCMLNILVETLIHFFQDYLINRKFKWAVFIWNRNKYLYCSLLINVMHLCWIHFNFFFKSESESDVTYDQVWWPILGICALHLTHPKWTHTAVNRHTHRTHTRSSGQPFMLRRPGSSWGFSALLKGTSVMVLRVERALYIHSPHLQFLPARDSNSQPFDYESDSL